MHERGRTKSWLTWITEVDKAGYVVREFLGVGKGQFAEQVVGVLPIMQRLIVPRLTRLKKQRIPVAAFG